MEEQTITLTEAELQAKIDEAVSSATQDLISKHNGEMATMRKENKELKNANLTAEEKARQDLEEQKLATDKELSELRAFKKDTVISQRLAKENLPSYLKNDSRLINAGSDTDFEKALKSVKADYESSLPKGNTHSSVVKTSTTTQSPNTDNTQTEAFAKMGEALQEIVGGK